jgi:hypothetical protein
LPRLYGHLDLNLLAELVKHGHEPVDREPAELRIADAREISVTDSGPRLGLAR